MYDKVISLNGKEAGPTSLILVGVHGNEKCGVDAIEKIFPTLQIQKGRVFIVYGNPRAIEKDVRCVEANLNRMFKPDADLSASERSSYEYARAQFLKEYLNQADALLDIHASSTPESKTFVICEDNARDIVKYLPVSLIVSGFDAVEPGGTDYYMNTNGKIGMCIECGYFKEPTATEIAEKAIWAFLAAQGNITRDIQTYSQTEVGIESLYMTKTDNFKLTRDFKDFEKITVDQVVGIDGMVEIKTASEGLILFARNRNKMSEEAFLFGKYKNKV